MNRTGLIAKISIKCVLPTCIWKYFWRISRYFVFFGEFRGISWKYLNFTGPRPRELSEALKSLNWDRQLIIINSFNQIAIWRIFSPGFQKVTRSFCQVSPQSLFLEMNLSNFDTPNINFGTIAWEKSQHVVMSPADTQQNDVWGISTEIPHPWMRYHYPDWMKQIFNWWCVTNAQIRVVLTHHRYGISALTFLRHHFQGKPEAASWNVGCFLRLMAQYIKSVMVVKKKV